MNTRTGFTLTLFTILLLPLFVGAQNIDYQGNSVSLWQGFEFKWKKTNHRLNQLGSLVSMNDEGVVVKNSASSGSHSDNWKMNNHFTYLYNSSDYYYILFDTIQLNAPHHELFEVNSVIDLNELGIEIKGNKNYLAFLNGFELISNPKKDADKLKTFDLNVNINESLVETTVKIAMACEAPNKMLSAYECSDDSLNYALNYAVLIVESSFNSSSISSSASMDWGNKGGKLYKLMEPKFCRKQCKKPTHDYNSDVLDFPDSLGLLDEGSENQSELNYAHGFSGFSISLTKENHILSWSMYLGEKSKKFKTNKTIIKSGSNNTNSNLYFSPWKKGMKPRYLLFSFAKASSANMNASILSLPFKGEQLQVSLLQKEKYRICSYCSSARQGDVKKEVFVIPKKCK